ncbi:MAG: hypothetical protein M3Y50_11790 [Acidobacteriota bacterium]|nr:hypothetical protein [Acidobacteriota bacterium]
MSSLPASRTARRLLKIASLGLAGLLAGLLTGCTQHNTVAANSSLRSSGFSSASTDNLSPLSESLDAHRIPSLRHPPSTRRLEYGSVPSSHPQLMPVYRTRS